MKNKSIIQCKINYVIATVFLLVGISIGFFANSLQSTERASAQEIELAKNEIAKLFDGKTVDACWEVFDGENFSAEKYELTFRNLRINKYANRAIITDCGEFDTLLAKNKSGQWIQSSVNLQIGNRVNPVWQKECGIEDITVADDTVRPENSTIDEMNLEECRQLNRQ